MEICPVTNSSNSFWFKKPDGLFQVLSVRPLDSFCLVCQSEKSSLSSVSRFNFHLKCVCDVWLKVHLFSRAVFTHTKINCLVGCSAALGDVSRSAIVILCGDI